MYVRMYVYISGMGSGEGALPQPHLQAETFYGEKSVRQPEERRPVLSDCIC